MCDPKDSRPKEQIPKQLALADMQAIGFDWDGTLVDSMKVKSEAFAESIIANYPEVSAHRGDIKVIYLASRGNPRTYQLGLVREHYGLPELSVKDLGNWSDFFTSLYIDKQLPLFPETIGVLEHLTKKGLKLFLSSSVPQPDLDRTLDNYSVKKYFEFVLGTGENGFKKGPPHLNHVSEALGIPLNKIAFCGDGGDDVKGANKAGCLSIGRANIELNNSIEELQASKPDILIKTLDEIVTCLQKR